MSAAVIPFPRRRPTLIDVSDWTAQDVRRYAKDNGWTGFVPHYRPGKDRDRVLIQRVFE